MVSRKSTVGRSRNRGFRLIVGYTTGVFDLFHVGHVNLLRNASALCDRLVVGVTVDELASYKGKKPTIPFGERIEVVRGCKFVDVAIPQESLDKVDAWERLKFDRLFVGDDWFNNSDWKRTEADLARHGVTVTYFPYTSATSSTLINEILKSRL